MGKAWLERIAVVVLTFIACEVGLRMALTQPDFQQQLLRRGGGAGTRMVHLQRGLKHTVSSPIDHDAELGWTMRPGVYAAQGWTINAQGMRHPRDVELSPTSQPRVVLFGDSFAFGDNAADDQTMSHHLAGVLTGAEVLNLGVIGYGHGQMLRRLERDVLPLAPEVVVLPLMAVDLHRGLLDFTWWFKPQFAVREGRAVQVSSPPSSMEDALSSHWYGSRVLDALQMLTESPPPQHGATPEEIELADALLGEMARVSATAGMKLVLVLAPSPPEVTHGLDYFASSVIAERFRGACEHDGVVCVDLSKAVFDAAAEGLPMASGAHWSPELNQLLGVSLGRALQEARLVD